MSIQRSVLERLRKGDEQAFEVVYHAFHRRIYGFLLSSLGEDESAAEDLLQSFFLRLWEARSNIDVDKDFTAYLFTIARNLVYKELREILLLNYWKNMTLGIVWKLTNCWKLNRCIRI